MQDRPTAVELLEAAQRFCERDLIPNLSGRVGFHVRVLRNVLGIIKRELTGEERALERENERLGLLLDKKESNLTSMQALRDEARARNTELAALIRAGEMDERFDEVLEALYATVAEKLAIANPGYASADSEA